MSTDVLYPVLIGAGCLLVALLVHLLTRPKLSRDDIRVPNAGVVAQTNKTATPSEPVRELRTWHVEHESTLLDFFDRIVSSKRNSCCCS